MAWKSQVGSSLPADGMQPALRHRSYSLRNVGASAELDRLPVVPSPPRAVALTAIAFILIASVARAGQIVTAGSAGSFIVKVNRLLRF